MSVMKFNKWLSGLILSLVVFSSSMVSPVDAASTPILKWKVSTLNPSTSYRTSALASINSTGSKTWTVSGSCKLKAGKITTKASGFCTVKLKVGSKGKFSSKNFSKKFKIQVADSSATSVVLPTSFTNRTTSNGLGNNSVTAVQVVGTTVYAATFGGGLSISTDGGNTFTSRTTANGLGNNGIYSIYDTGSTLYAGTYTGGLSISTDGGNTFTTRTTANGLGSNTVRGVQAIGTTVYAATDGGLSISTDGGNTFTTRTTANGLGLNKLTAVQVVGSTVYAATYGGGLSISTDGGNSFRNYSTAQGLGSNTVLDLFVVGSKVYVATENGGLSISN
jgi:hypothetical protein